MVVGKYAAAPLLSLTFLMYIVVSGFASCCCLDRLIEAQADIPGFGGNEATVYFLIMSLLAAVVGIASKLIGGNHVKAWKDDGCAAAASTAMVARSITALAFLDKY